MRRCKNGRIIPYLEAKMGFDSGPGIMFRRVQSLELNQSYPLEVFTVYTEIYTATLLALAGQLI